MNRIFLSVALFLLALGCIREEAPNVEADILCCSLPDGVMTGAVPEYWTSFDREYNAYPLDIEVNFGTDLTALAPFFTLSDGAVISPPNGSVQDFSAPVRYTVTSENGMWHRTYRVNIHYPETVDVPDILHLDSANANNGFYVFNEGPLTWCSGNPGFQLSMSGAKPEEYPTWFSSDGYQGGCAVLTTRTTGSLGEMGGMPIAAGNLFLGKFVLSMAMGDALGATQFGTPYQHKPLCIRGMYKYSSPGGQDYGSAYALFFERTDGIRYLDGHAGENGWNHPNMVAFADGGKIGPAGEWTEFRMDFDYGRYGRPIDSDKLSAGGYCLAIVFSSSFDGASFKGEPGSTLMIDEIEIVYE